MPWYHKDFVTWLATVDENHMIFVFQLLDTFCAFANTHNFIPPHQLLAHDSPLSGDLKSYIEDYCQVMARQQTLAGDVEALGRLFFPKDSERLALLTMKNPNAIQADHLPLQPALEPMTAPDTESEDIGLSKDHDKSANVINIRALLSATDHKSWDIVSDEDEFQEIWSAYKEVNDTKASMGHQANQPLGESEWKIHKKELCKAMANVVDIVEDDNNINVGKVRTAANLEIELLACRIMGYLKDVQAGKVQMPPWARTWCRSKAIVAQLMDVDFGRRLVLAPEAELKRKESNLKGNRAKGRYIKDGRKLQQAAIPSPEDLPANDAGSGQPRKKRRMETLGDEGLRMQDKGT